MISVLLVPARAHADAAKSPGATTGILTPAGTVDPLHLAPGATLAPSHSALSRFKGTRPIHAQHSAPVAPGSLPAAPSTPIDKKGLGALLTSFDGVSSLDSKVTNFGAQFEPPDQGLCVGNGFVLEPVNSAYTIYRRDGSVVAGPFNVNALFNEGFTEFTSDPRCYYDSATHTWFAIILFIGTDSSGNFSAPGRTDIAVNTSGDPTKPWTVYHLDNNDDGTNGTPSHPGCPCYGDQPLLGIDGHNVYISTNEFSILGPEFNAAQIYAISKSDLRTNSSPVHFVHYDNLSVGGAPATSVQPAINPTGAPAEYFLSSLDPNGTTDNRIGVWALTKPEAVADGKVPTLSNTVITTETYGVPPNAVQKGATSLLNTGDDRMQQVQFIGGELWGALDTAITLPQDTAQRSGVAWFKIHPHLNDDAIGGATLTDQGYVASAGNYLLYPALQAGNGGRAAMVLTISGATLFPSAAYTVLQGQHAGFGPITIAAPGSGPYDPKAGRWGDYSAAALDPSGESVWMATEYMPPTTSQTPDGVRNWGTRILQVGIRG